ncbi:MAG: M15 family metallopeptidase, partial [Deltaproteobacteria bacterium]|nr:M15 family metallopeptidase [Deltaproteobacteria bacterium]
MPASRVWLVWVVVSSLLLGPACAVPEDEHRCDGDGQAPAIGRALEPLSSVSCEERSDTGYRSGDSFSIDVVTIDGKPVEVDTANAYMVMAEAASRDGVEIRIVSGFRTMAEQEYLYACYVNCNCNGCNLAARPGHSNHQSGHALDLNTSSGGVLSWLEAHGGDYGFSRTVPSEPWHWEWWGGGPGGGPCGRPEPPAPGACPALGADGGEIEETSGCTYLHGPSTYWRSEAVGHGGSLRWTNAFSSDAPSNWARWYLELVEAGDYAVEIWA